MAYKYSADTAEVVLKRLEVLQKDYRELNDKHRKLINGVEKVYWKIGNATDAKYIRESALHDLCKLTIDYK
jgi:hypothetical protein